MNRQRVHRILRFGPDERLATAMKVLITLNDVEPAVRLNAALEAEGVETAVVSPLDDIRAALKRERPTSSSSAAI